MKISEISDHKFDPVSRHLGSSLRQLQLGLNQGDQIERIFAFWAMVFFAHFFENYRRDHKFLWGDFPAVKSYINFTPNEFCYILGDFFANSSGHPAINDVGRRLEVGVGVVGKRNFSLFSVFNCFHEFSFQMTKVSCECIIRIFYL
jgi:hypothetical protein